MDRSCSIVACTSLEETSDLGRTRYSPMSVLTSFAIWVGSVFTALGALALPVPLTSAQPDRHSAATTQPVRARTRERTSRFLLGMGWVPASTVGAPPDTFDSCPPPPSLSPAATPPSSRRQRR